jgi:CRP/FNR family nitrogen fixation transcriptional regulator
MLAVRAANPPPVPRPPVGGQIPDTIWPAAELAALSAEDVLYREGDAPQHWYRLLSGTMRVVRGLADGRRHVAEFVFPGQLFGNEPGPHRLFAAEAVTAATLLVYPTDAIELRTAQDHLARRTIRQVVAEQLAAAQMRAVTLGTLNGGERVAVFLVEMARRHSTGHVAELPMNRTDIADHLGLTVETLSRLLGALRRSGAIKLHGANRIELCDRAAFEKGITASALRRCA